MLLGREEIQDRGSLPGEKKPLSGGGSVSDGCGVGRGLEDQPGMFSSCCQAINLTRDY